MDTNHEFFLKKAITLANENIKNGGGPFGAVITLNGEVIGTGANRVTPNMDPTAHAEVQAIREACKKINNFSLEGAILYTSCEPCPMCLAATYWARIDKLYYWNTRKEAAEIGFDDSYLYDQVSLTIEQRDLKMTHLNSTPTHTPFETWEKSLDKTPY